MKKTFLAAAALAFAGCSTSGGDQVRATRQSTTIYSGGTIARAGAVINYRPESLVIEGGTITFVGDDGEAKRRYPNAEVVDVTDRTILPGLVDAHAHITGLGEALERVSLTGTTSLDEVVARIAERAAILAPGEWVLGRGWDQNDWPVKEFPTAAAIDAKVSDRPVWVRRIDGHASLANSAALRLAEITAATPDPPGGKILRDTEGNPTGVFIDNATDLIDKVVPPASDEQRRRQLRAAMENIAANGLTGVHDAGADAQTIRVMREMADAGEMPIHVYSMLTDDAALLDQWFASGPLVNYGGRLTVRAVKLYADGALGSRGAALLAPYSDDPGNSGLILTPAEHLVDVSGRARKAGFQVCTHAIGDRAVRVAIESYEAAGVRPQDRFRIEHLQVVAPTDFDRLAARGIIASMQPTHATSDMPWAEARLGPQRTLGAYAWRSVLHASAPLAFGSDFPVEEVNPFLGIHAAVNRQDLEGRPESGWYPTERLSSGEALAAFTKGAAFASFSEERAGDIAPGQRADLTIIEGTTLPKELWKAKVAMTVVGGEIVYRR